MGKTLVMYINNNKSNTPIEINHNYIKLTYQLSFEHISLTLLHHTRGKLFILGPRRRNENQLLSLKHPCWLSCVLYVNMI